MSLLIFALPVFAHAATCFRSGPTTVNDVKGPVVISILKPNDINEGGEIRVTGRGFEAKTTIFCTTGQPARCQLVSDGGQIQLLGNDGGTQLITRGGALSIATDDGGGLHVRVVDVRREGPSTALAPLTPQVCHQTFGEPPVVKFQPRAE